VSIETTMTPEERTETRLLERWRSGDKKAGDQLLRRYWPVLRSFFRRKRAANVEELVQSTLVACIQAVGRFAERSSFKTYVLGIARNQFLMSLRADHVAPFGSGTISTAPEESPSGRFAMAQERKFLLRALLQLPPEFRKVLMLLYWDGCSVEEIGQELGVPVGTVKSRLARGRAILREQLESMSPPIRLQLGLKKLLDARER
jgi:RNA polymerase sigma factor (sigma-70 family)